MSSPLRKSRSKSDSRSGGKSRGKSRTNITIDPGLLEEARAYGLNVSSIAEQALAAAVRAEAARRWEMENAEAIAERTAWIERLGPPLADLQVWKP